MKKSKRKHNPKLKKNYQKSHKQNRKPQSYNLKPNQNHKKKPNTKPSVKPKEKEQQHSEKEIQKLDKKSDLNPKQADRKKILLYGAVSAASILLLTYFIISFYFSYHFYNNTTINDVSASKRTVNQVEEAINKPLKSYELNLKERNNEKEQINGEKIDLCYAFDGTMKKILKNQNGFAWPVYLFLHREIQVPATLKYNETLLKQQINQLNCLKKENNKAPVNAYISEFDGKEYKIVPEDPGKMVKKDIFYGAVTKKVNSLDSYLVLEKERCYEEAQITSDSPKLVKAVKEMNHMAGAKITYEFGNAKETIDGKMISKWLSVNDKFKVTLDKDKVKKFVKYIKSTYNTYGKVRSFKTSYHKNVKISGGDYGWWLNSEKEVKELTKLIHDGKQTEKEPTYIQKARQYGKNDIGDTYVEISLSNQHLFFYKNGKKLLETSIVSGNLAKGHGTPGGTYYVKYKERDAILKGPNYASPVKRWMPFNGGIGLHDASWRSSFGGRIYKTNGSHGCINMPTKAAKRLFQYIERGIPVVVY